MKSWVRKRHSSVKAKFHYAIQLSSSLAGRRPARELVAELVSHLSQTGSSYIDMSR